MFMEKTQYSILSGCQLDLNSNENPIKLFCGCGSTDSKVYRERQKTPDYQHAIEGEEPSQ